MSNNALVFKTFLENVSKCPTIPQFLKEAQSTYHIKAYQICKINPNSAYKLYDSIHLKFYRKDTHIMSYNWFENELRLFVWIVFCYVHLKNIKIQQLGEQDWDFFAKIFNHKDPKLFQYQVHCFYLDNKGKNWQLEEENLLKEIMEQSTANQRMKCSKIKWHQISKQLFHLSNKKFLRTPKQCRQRWNNHLDPSKVKGMWKRQQCLLMFQYVQEHGKKWANIVKLLKNVRNEHSIKNKFNSLMKKQAKSNKNMSQQEIYAEIIVRIKSAIANHKYSKSNPNIDFDLEDQDEEIDISRKFIHEENKTYNFAEKLMQKLMSFGNKEDPQPLPKKQPYQQEKYITKVQKTQISRQQQHQLSQNSSQSPEQLQPNHINSSLSQNSLSNMNNSGNKQCMRSQFNRESSQFDQRLNELNADIFKQGGMDEGDRNLGNEKIIISP